MPHGEKNMATNKWAILGGIALNVEYTRKYGFDATAAAKVTAKLVAVPPPTLFQEAIHADMAGRVRRATVSTNAGTATTTGTTFSRPLIGSPTASSQDGTSAGENEQGFQPLVLLVEEQAGIEYTLDDGVTAPRRGRVSADGVLTNQISTRAKRFVITFADGSEPLELILDEPTLDDEEEEFDREVDEFAEIWEELEEEELEEELEELTPGDPTEEEAPVLSLIIPEKAGKVFTLDDGIREASTGIVADDGTLVHPVSPDSTTVKIQFEDEPEPIEFEIAA
jgi:hypothetical protein